MDTANIAIVPGTLAKANLQVVQAEIQQLAAALQIQLTQHFGPAWNISGTVAAFPDLTAVPGDYWPIIISDQISDPNAGGYHTDDGHKPYAIVDYAAQVDTWTTTASHEMLEMVADPWGNKVTDGAPIDPDKPDHTVQFLVEICDPVELNADAYMINLVVVSNFVYPSFYGPDGTGAPFDHGNKISAPRIPANGGSVAWQDLTDGYTYQLDIDPDGSRKIKRGDPGTFKGHTPLRESANIEFGPRKRGDFPKATLVSLERRRANAKKAATVRAEMLLKRVTSS
jgi:hypothetical protein